MATTISNKQLGELLQEKQEPFLLDIYLLEKGCLRNRLGPEPGFRCCLVNSKGFLKRSSLSLGVNKKRKIFPNCCKVVKAVFGNVDRLKVKKNCRKNQEETREMDRSTKSDPEESPNILQEKEVEQQHSKLQQRYKENNRELSAVFVLNEALFGEDLSARGNRKQTTRTKDSNLPLPFCKFVIQTDEPKHRTNFVTQHAKSKRVLQQSKQLLVDCVKELIESHKWKLRREKNLLQFLGPEEIGKLLCEDARILSRLSGNESNITQLLKVDFGASIREWCDFESQVKEVGTDIGDEILNNIIEEIFEDNVELVQPHL